GRTERGLSSPQEAPTAQTSRESGGVRTLLRTKVRAPRFAPAFTYRILARIFSACIWHLDRLNSGVCGFGFWLWCYWRRWPGSAIGRAPFALGFLSPAFSSAQCWPGRLGN